MCHGAGYSLEKVRAAAAPRLYTVRANRLLLRHSRSVKGWLYGMPSLIDPNWQAAIGYFITEAAKVGLGRGPCGVEGDGRDNK